MRSLCRSSRWSSRSEVTSRMSGRSSARRRIRPRAVRGRAAPCEVDRLLHRAEQPVEPVGGAAHREHQPVDGCRVATDEGGRELARSRRPTARRAPTAARCAPRLRSRRRTPHRRSRDRRASAPRHPAPHSRRARPSRPRRRGARRRRGTLPPRAAPPRHSSPANRPASSPSTRRCRPMRTHSSDSPSASRPSASAMAPCSSTLARPAGCAGPGSAMRCPHRMPRASTGTMSHSSGPAAPPCARRCSSCRCARRELASHVAKSSSSAAGGTSAATTSWARFSSTTAAPSVCASWCTMKSAGEPRRLSAVNRSRTSSRARRAAVCSEMMRLCTASVSATNFTSRCSATRARPCSRAAASTTAGT